MNYRTLGKTGLLVSEISFGTIPILSGEVSILPHYYGLSDKEALAVMEKAYELGINLYDTAVVPEYGDAEKKVGKFLKTHPNIIISDKARAYDKGSMESALTTSLRNLGSDYCDIYFVHQVAPENQDIVFDDGALETLANYKDKGHIKAIGIATHHYNVALKAAQDNRVDVIQIPGNILERGFLERIEQNRIFQSKGLLLCKVFAAGVLTDYFPPSALVNFALSYPISSAILGFGSTGQVVATTSNIATNYKRLSLSEVEQKLDTVYETIPCMRCQKCVCSNQIEIESVFRYYNYYNLGHGNWAYNKLNGLDDDLYIKCLNCDNKTCLNCCPNNINIQKEIQSILQKFKGGNNSMEQKQLKPGKDYIGVGVGAVILRDNKILLLLRNKAPEAGCWTIPGGKVEFGETVEAAILREVQEEVGTEAKIIAPLGVTNHILKEEGTHYVSPRFLVSIIGEPTNMEPSSHSEMKWFSIDDLPENVTMTTQKALSAFLTWHNEKM